MKQFGKFENGIFIRAPKNIKDKKFTYFNPSSAKYKEHGYKEIIAEKYPNDGKVYTALYTEEADYIKQSWQEVALSTEEPNYQENNSLEVRVKLLEEQIAFLLDYGKFREPWQDHKYHGNDK